MRQAFRATGEISVESTKKRDDPDQYETITSLFILADLDSDHQTQPKDLFNRNRVQLQNFPGTHMGSSNGN